MKILLIEDDRVFHELFTACLPPDLDVSLEIVENLADGLDIADDFDICIIDLVLPDSPNINNTIKVIDKKITRPRVIFSSVNDPHLAYQLGKMRIGFIPKGVSADELLMILSNMIGFCESTKYLYELLQYI